MMTGKAWRAAVFLAMVFAAVLSHTLLAQGTNASVNGEIADPRGGVVAGANVELVSQQTSASFKFASDANGLYVFQNVEPGSYRLIVAAPGFTEYIQDGIVVRVGYPVRINVSLKVGTATQRVEVKADVSALNYENAELRNSIDPAVIEQVPLLVSGSIRSAANFASILPGIARGTGDVTGAHINGGQSQTGTVVLDGSPLFNPSGIQGLTGAVLDFPQSPDIISEFQVLTSNYDPQYSGGSGVTVEHVRSGTDKLHGTVYEYNRNAAMNASQWGSSGPTQDVENDFGGNLGGHFRLPFVSKEKVKTYFFGNFEGFTIAGGASRQTLSLPSLQERQGDFRDWTDSSGNLIPIYDPATTQRNSAYDPSAPTGPGNLPYLRQQFMGCNGATPNVICPTDPRLQNSLANQWFKALPSPTSAGPLANYLAPPVPNFLGTDAYTYLEKIDMYVGAKDHLSEMFFYKYLPETTATLLPVTVSNSGTSYKRTPVVRLSYDHIFSERLVNHFGFGWQDDKYFGGGIDGNSASALPQIPGVASHDYPPQMLFSGGFTGYGTGQGNPNLQPWLSSAYLVNDVIYLTKGRHTLSFGGDFRASENSPTFITNESGQFNFAATETGLIGLNSGSPIASFILEQVDTANVTYYTSHQIVARQNAYALFFGDTWHATSKLSVNPGVRYEVGLPSYDANNRFAYFNPTLPNPGAGNLLGAVSYAGSGLGRSGVRYPEAIWYKGVAPRLGFSYAATPNTVVRSGYGIYIDDVNMPGYDGGISQDGYNTYAVFDSSLGGLQSAFTLNQGIPQTYPVPPQLRSTIDNGLNAPIYRPRDANRLPYSQQWNFTIEHEMGPNTHVAIAYVGSKGTRLLSQIEPQNAINPQYLSSLGPALYDVFQPGESSLDGVNAPFSDFATVMTGCAPSVAQALVKFPQYCNGIIGRNENKGSSTYHSFQLSAERRLTQGLWALVTYTNSKLITNANSAENTVGSSLLSPYQPGRLKSLALEDVPQVFNFAYTYELPFGVGKHWLDQPGITNRLVGGWTFSGVFRAQSGIPFQITSSSCNVPSQFQSSCLPGLLPGKNPFAQSASSLQADRPFLSASAFEPVSSFNFYTGYGSPTQNFRQPGYNDYDIGLQKTLHITEAATFQLRGDAFNILNSHHFNEVGISLQGGGAGGSAFTTDLASPNFGLWNGTVTRPRSIQVSGRISF